MTVKHLDVIKKENYYEVNSVCYEEAKRLKNISDQAKFIASFYNNDLIEINGALYRVIGVNNDPDNKIEVNMVDKRIGRLYKTIGGKTQSIKKYSTDILGNLYEAKSKQDPQMIMKG